jgi:hypothetical protein
MAEDVPQPDAGDLIPATPVESIGVLRDVHRRFSRVAHERGVSIRVVADESINAALDAAGAPPTPPELVPMVRFRKRRGRGVMGPRARTIAAKRMSLRELRAGAAEYPPVEEPRPTTRSDCEHGINDQRPCPWVSCRYHLYLEVNELTGSIKLVFPHLEPWQLEETCALDVAARGGTTLEEVGALSNRTRERVRQEETRALVKILGSGRLRIEDLGP